METIGFVFDNNINLKLSFVAHAELAYMKNVNIINIRHLYILLKILALNTNML